MKIFNKKSVLVALAFVAIFGMNGPAVVSALDAPLIAVSVTPSQFGPLPFGGGPVVYSYRVTNPGTVSMSNVGISDTRCAAMTGAYGDLNTNGLLDPGETWVYTCSIYVATSATNLARVQGSGNGLVATNYAFASVIVNVPGFPAAGLAL